jgi:hypothetical protein
MTKGLDTEFFISKTTEYSEWRLYMFGSLPDKPGMIYKPVKGYEPNWFVRWMMKVCFDCLWIKGETHD